MIERTYESEGEGPLNELSEAVFGYKEAIEEDELTSVDSVTVDGSAVVRISYERTSPEVGDVEFVVDLDATSLLPARVLVRTADSAGRDLAEIGYKIDSLASLPELPEIPTTPQTGSESYSELFSDDLAKLDEFPGYAPNSRLLDGYTSEVIHHEVATSEERSSVVSVYYWPADIAQLELAIPDLQVSNVSAASVDATHLEASGATVSLPNGAKAVAVREGEALLVLTWDIGGTRVTVFGNLDVFSESQILEIAGSLGEITGS